MNAIRHLLLAAGVVLPLLAGATDADIAYRFMGPGHLIQVISGPYPDGRPMGGSTWGRLRLQPLEDAR